MNSVAVVHSEPGQDHSPTGAQPFPRPSFAPNAELQISPQLSSVVMIYSWTEYDILQSVYVHANACGVLHIPAGGFIGM